MWIVAISMRMHGQTINLVGATATQAVIQYDVALGGSCRVEVSESPQFSPLVNAVNPALFPGSDMDSRAIVSGNTRTLVIGQRTSARSKGRTYSLALRTNTAHYLRLTCPGSTRSLIFETAPVSGIVPEAPPFLQGADGNMGVPDFDWEDRSKPVIDPQSGVAMYRIGDPRDYSSDTSHSFEGGSDGFRLGFPDLIPVRPRETTTGTPLRNADDQNTLFLPIDSNKALTAGGWALAASQSHPITDMGIQLKGRGTAPSSEDRTIDICISVDSGRTCYSDAIAVTMPNATSDLGVIPSTYPAPLFAGWGKPVTRELFNSTGIVTVSGSSVTLVKDRDGTPINWYSHSAKARFQAEWSPGTSLYIANSSPICPLNLCTIASVQSQTSLTIQEPLTLPESVYRFSGVGFRITKRSAIGSIDFSATYRLAKSFVLHQGAGSACSTGTVVVTVDRLGNPLNRSITGRLCLFPLMYEAGGRLYFVGESEVDVRFLALLKEPSSIPGHVTADLPTEGGGPNLATFDRSNPNVFYTVARTFGGSPAVFRLRYTGDYRENTAAWWRSGNDLSLATGNQNVAWENMTKSSAGKDLRAQVLSQSLYDESKWGRLSLSLAGFSASYIVFNTPPVASESPCWVFVFTTATGGYVRGWNTLNGGGEGSLAGGCHSVSMAAGRILVSNNGLVNQNPNSLWGGPFDVPVSSVKRGSGFSSDASLPGLPDGSYDNTCPADLPVRWKELGAIGNQCVTVRIDREPCSAFATMAERLYTPCPGDPSKSWVGSPIAEGQDFYDASTYCDNEHLLVVRRTNLPSGGIELVMLRDAGPGYCCNKANARGRSCLADVTQAIHGTKWSLRMKPSGSCCTCTQVYDPATGRHVVELPELMRGHWSYGLLASGNHTFAGIGPEGSYLSRYDVPPTDFGMRQTAAFTFWPRFAGTPSSLNAASQSYIKVAGPDSADFERRFATDWRHANGPYGVVAEAAGQSIGSSYTIAMVTGTKQLYKVNGISGFYNLKLNPLILWAGRYVFREKSSPVVGNTLTDSDEWQFCFAWKAGECRAGSAAGDVFVNAPGGLDTSLSFCHASQISYRSLCIFGGTPVFGQLMQVRLDQDDLDGLWQRRLGFGLTVPGSQYVYSSAHSTPNGKSLLFTAFNLQGVYSVPVLMQLPKWPTDGIKRNTYVPVEVRSSGFSYIEFGYGEFGSPDSFYCTPRAETCRVSAEKLDETNPFQYASETLLRARGSWTIAIPALPGRVLYYRIVTDGVPGPIQPTPIP